MFNGKTLGTGGQIRKHRLAAILFASATAGLGTSPMLMAQNVVSTWTGGATADMPGSGNWSVPGNWDLLPTSSTTTELHFGGDGSTGYTSLNDIGTGSFTLNALVLNSNSTATETIGAFNSSVNGLTFDGNNAVINSTGTGSFNIGGTVLLNTALTINASGGGTVNFTGPFNLGPISNGSANNLPGLNSVNVTAGTVQFSGATTFGGVIPGTNGATGALNSDGTPAQLNISAGATVISTGTLNLDVNGYLARVTHSDIVGAGTLELRSTTNSVASPDLFFGADTNANSFYGARLSTTLDLGSSQRYIWVNTSHNSVSNYDGSEDARIDGNIIGSGGITLIGQNTYGGLYPNLTLAGSNTFTGKVEVDNGSIYLQSTNALNLPIASANKLLLNPSATQQARLFLYGNNANVSNLESSSTGSSLIANGNVTNPVPIAPATLTINQTANTTFSGQLVDAEAEYDRGSGNASGPLSIVLAPTSTGVLTLSGASTYTGTTTIAGGTLALTSTASLGITAITAASGATFAPKIGTASVTLGGILNLNSGSTFDMQDGQTGTLNITGGNSSTPALNLGGANLKLDLGVGSTDSVAVTNGVSVTGTNTLNFNATSNILVNGTYNLISAASVSGSGSILFPNNSSTESYQIGGKGTTYTLSLATTSTGETLTVTGAVTSFWTGANGNVWSAGTGSTGTNWSSDLAGTMGAPIPNSQSNVVFSISGGGQNSANTILGADFEIGALTFTSDANPSVTIGGSNTLTIDSGGITIDNGSGTHTIATGGLVLGGSQTWTNNSQNPFTVSAPVGGASSNLTFAGAGSFVLSGSNTYGTTTINSGSTVLIGNGAGGGSFGSGAVTNNGTITVNRTSDGVIASGISGTGTFTQAGSNTTTINGNLTQAMISVNAGNLIVNGGVSGTSVTLSNGGNLSSSGVSSFPAGSLTINSGSTYTSSGQIQLPVSKDSASGQSGIQINSGGSLVLASTTSSATNPDIFFGPDHSGTSYYGSQIITDNNDTGSSTGGNLNLGSGTRYIEANSGHNTVAKYLTPHVGVDAFISANIIGTGGFHYQGNQEGTSGFFASLVLYGYNTFTGPLEVDQGSIYLFGPDALDGQNNLTLSNSNTSGASYSHFFLLGQTATISNLASTGTTPGNTGIANGNPHDDFVIQPGSLTINQTTNTTFGGTIADTLTDNYDGGSYVPGNLSISLVGTGTLTLSGKSSYSGPTTIGTGSAGSTPTLALASGGSLGNTNITVNTGARFSPAMGSSIGPVTSGTLLTVTGGTLDFTSGGTVTTTGVFSLNEPAGSNSTLLSLNAAALNFAATATGPDVLAINGPASVSGTNIINISMLGTATASAATYNLITATSGLTGTFEFSNGSTRETIPYGTGTISLGLINTDGSEELTINGGATQPLNAYWTNAQGTGTWNTGGGGTAGTNFAIDSGGNTDPKALPGNTSNVFFSASTVGGPVTSTLGANFDINSLTFTGSQTSPVTITGSNTLQIEGGGITVQFGSGGHTISTAGLIIGTNQTWTNNSQNPLTIASNVSGGNLTIGAGSAPIVLTGSNTYGTTTVQPGATLQLGNGGATLGTLGAGTATVNGTLLIDQAGNNNFNASGIVGTGVISQGGVGTLTLSNVASTLGLGAQTGTLVLNSSLTLANSANRIVIGSAGTVISNGTLKVGAASNCITIAAGGQLISNGQLLIAPSTSTTYTTISGGGTLVLNSSSGSVTAPDFMSTSTSNSYYGVAVSTKVYLGTGTHVVGSIAGAGGVSGNDSYGQYGTGDLELLGSLSGPGNLNLDGLPYSSQFEVRLGADNSSWTGSLMITGGDIALTSNNALTANNSVTFNTATGTNNGTAIASALYLFGNNTTVGSINSLNTSARQYIRNGASSASSPAVLTIEQTIPGTFAGVISNGPNDYKGGTATSGTLGITKDGPATLTLTGLNTYTGPTTVLNGQLVFAPSGTGVQVETISTGSGITINTNASIAVAVVANQANRALLVTGGLSLAGNTGAWTSQLDLGNNDLVVKNGELSQLSDQLAQGYASGAWNGTYGISSTAAANDTTHLTALGVIQNSVDGTTTGATLYGTNTSSGLFDGTYNGSSGDVLVKYTYYGDTNLDGEVDGSDYSRIDNGFINDLTGWSNGDFNYDGVINGSDYTLIDNAFNTQGASLAAEIGSPTAQIAGTGAAGSSVPEPVSVGMLTLGAAGLLGRRRRN
jgi:fibronectin-binding autotransporter adhesin